MGPERFLLPVVACAILSGCGDDRSAGGTVTTEAGNAVTARIFDREGRPVPGATVVARPAEAIDLSTSPSWTTVASDRDGWATFHLPDGIWTLEARFDSLGSRQDVRVGRDTNLANDTLGRLRDLSGIAVGIEAGSRLFLPGLARATTVQRDGSFRFPLVPPGIQRIRSEQGPEWTATVPGPSPALAVSLDQGHPLPLAPAPAIARHGIPDSLVPSSSAVVVDSTGRAYPVVAGSQVGQSRWIWAPAIRSGVVAIGSSPSTAAASPFAAEGGLRLAWIPDLSRSCQIPTTGGLRWESSVEWGRDSLEGGVARTALGTAGGALDSGVLPDTGAFSASVRVRTGTQGIGQLWVLDWSDPLSGRGLRVGIGADRLWLRWGSVDTSVVVAGTAWSTIAWTAGSGSLQVSVDGKRVVGLVADSVSVRSTWSVRSIAPSGGVDLAWILAWSGALDPDELSKPR